MRGRAPGHSESHMSHAHTLLFSNNARRRTQREIHGPNHSLNLTLAALQQINNFIGKCTQMPQIYLFFFPMEKENSRGTHQYKANVILVFNLSCRDQGNRDHLHLNRAPWAYQAWSHLQSWGWGDRSFIASVLQMWEFGFRRVRITQPSSSRTVARTQVF